MSFIYPTLTAIVAILYFAVQILRKRLKIKFELGLIALYIGVLIGIYYGFELNELYTPPPRKYSPLDYFHTFPEKQTWGIKLVSYASLLFWLQYVVRVFVSILGRE